MSESEQTVNTAECVEVVRALVAAFEAKGETLRRALKDEYAPESYLLPWRFEISAELIERGLKALGLPTPEVPKPKKIPSCPTPAQGVALAALAVEGATLTTKEGRFSMFDVRRSVISPGKELLVAEQTFDRLKAYKWIVLDREVNRYERLYKLTDAGREVLTWYQAKAEAAAPTH
jgi:hypothetical protein